MDDSKAGSEKGSNKTRGVKSVSESKECKEKSRARSPNVQKRANRRIPEECRKLTCKDF
jgi:hypothetical protein